MSRAGSREATEAETMTDSGSAKSTLRINMAALILLAAIVVPAHAQQRPEADRVALAAELERIVDAHFAARAEIEQISTPSLSVSLPASGGNLNVAV